MTDTPRNDFSALAGLALAGIAAYAGYRAMDAERKLADPNAKPLKDHIVDTARADLTHLRRSFEDILQKASESLDEFARKVDAKAEDLKARANATTHAEEGAVPPAAEPTI